MGLFCVSFFYQTGRLFYVNLLTKKAFASLPASVSASILNLGKDNGTSSSSSSSSSSHSSKSSTATQKELPKKKVTIPQSPQFSQMSWQRKKEQLSSMDH